MKKGHYIAIILVSLLLIAATIYVLYALPVSTQHIPADTANSPSIKPWFSFNFDWKSMMPFLVKGMGV